MRRVTGLRAKAAYKVDLLWLNFLGDSSMQELEMRYREFHDRTSFSFTSRFVGLIICVYLAYFLQSVTRHPREFEYQAPLLALILVSFLTMVQMHGRNAKTIESDDPGSRVWKSQSRSAEPGTHSSR